MLRTPLYAYHKSMGAQFQDYGIYGHELPSQFESTESEYHALRNFGGIIDFSFYGRIRLVGKDSLDLLHRMSTNDLKNLQPLQSAFTVLTTEKGRIIDCATVLNQFDHLLMIISPQNQEMILQWLDRYIIRDDVRTEDATGQTIHLGLFGPHCASAIENMFNIDVHGLLDSNGLVNINLNDQRVLISPSRFLDGFDLIADANAAETVLNVLRKSQLMFCGMEAYEIARIEEGHPIFRRELSDRYNPLEAGLAGAVSFTKGCYIGQEVIARLDSYQKIQRHLVRLKLSNLPLPENKILFQGKEIGHVTSSVRSIKYNAFIGLGYLKTEMSMTTEKLDLVDAVKTAKAEII
jgi:folate-binding protein YgfZ